MLSVNLNAIDWKNIYPSSSVKVFIPREMSQLSYRAEGTLIVSKTGYVYSLSSKRVLWLKFLGLAAYLSIYSVILKCKQIGLRVFLQTITQKDAGKLQQVFRLASIARKAVGGVCLQEKVEQFALAEIDYNNSDRRHEIDQPRSSRFTQGSYIARCMQPLFHVDQMENQKTLKEAVSALEKKQRELELALENKKTNGSQKKSGFWNFFGGLIQSEPYANLNENEIQRQHSGVQAELVKKKKLLDVTDRSQKYALMAILQQQCRDKQHVTEVECCNILWCRHEKICGLLHRVDVCGTSCWALDLACCFCCFWPAGRQTCLIC